MTKREEMRLAALDRAITLHTVGASDEAVLATASRFEQYLVRDWDVTKDIPRGEAD